MSENIIYQSLDEVMSERFGRYSKYIIQDRALPDVRDGLKPVQRRILYAMYHEGNHATRAYRKSAKTVGVVIGNYHPHGDSSVYDAMTRLSQDWKLNYPLVDMHGNNGSIDGDSAAAMRYTEARLSQISHELLNDIEKNTVAFAPNFDDTELEPVVLPASYPNLLVNGSTGISAGYATEIPSHNLAEIIDCTIALIKNPNLTIDEILEIVKGPDFPTLGIVQGVDGIKKAFETGRGRIVIRSKVEIVETKTLTQLVIKEIPYEVNKAELVRKMDEIRIDKVLDGIIAVRDESDREGLQIVIDLKKDTNANHILNYLYKNTNLQVFYNYNMVAIASKVPRCMGIKEILNHYIDHQVEVVTKRTIFDLNKANKRQHIVEGLIKAVSILDEIIALIRKAKDRSDAIKSLESVYDFSQEQAVAIVDLRLYRLTATDILELQKEHDELSRLIKSLNKILDSAKVLNNVIIKQLESIKNQFGQARKTVIEQEIEEIVIDKESLIADEQVFVSVTSDGYAKRSSLRSYQSSNSKDVTTKELERVIINQQCSTLDKLLLFTNEGNYLYVPVYLLTDLKWKEMGKHLNNVTSLPASETIIAGLVVSDFNQENYIVQTTKNGNIKKCLLKEYEVTRFSRPINCMNLKEDDQLIAVDLLNDRQNIILVSKNGHILKFNQELVNPQGIKASGVRGMNLDEDSIVSMHLTSETSIAIGLLTNRGHYKRIKLNDVEQLKRGAKGKKYIKLLKTNPHQVIDSHLIKPNDLIKIKTTTNEFEFVAKETPLSSNEDGLKFMFDLSNEQYLESEVIKSDDTKPVEESSIGQLDLGL